MQDSRARVAPEIALAVAFRVSLFPGSDSGFNPRLPGISCPTLLD